jgi:hypothetical protein
VCGRGGQREFLDTSRGYLFTKGRADRDDAHIAKTKAAAAAQPPPYPHDYLLMKC